MEMNKFQCKIIWLNSGSVKERGAWSRELLLIAAIAANRTDGLVSAFNASDVGFVFIVVVSCGRGTSVARAAGKTSLYYI